MITRENLKAVINLLPAKKKEKILADTREYCALYLYAGATGCWSYAWLTNNYERFSHIKNDGNVVVRTDYVKSVLQEVKNDNKR